MRLPIGDTAESVIVKELVIFTIMRSYPFFHPDEIRQMLWIGTGTDWSGSGYINISSA